MKRCTNCQTWQNNDTTACPECGAVLENNETEDNMKQKDTYVHFATIRNIIGVSTTKSLIKGITSHLKAKGIQSYYVLVEDGMYILRKADTQDLDGLIYLNNDHANVGYTIPCNVQDTSFCYTGNAIPVPIEMFTGWK